jgi:DNA-binding PadR family transcriptional regulator
MNKNIVNQKELPLTEPTFFILLSIAPAPKHGYAIKKEVEKLSDSRVVLSTGTLYGVIRRLLEKGWIKRIEEPEIGVTGRGRKTYKLTRMGRRILAAETTRLRSLATTAAHRLGVQGSDE